MNIHFLLVLLCIVTSLNFSISLDAVVLTTTKDLIVFERSILSALRYLVDVNNFYVVTNNAADIRKAINVANSSRIKFVDESIYPFTIHNITNIMIDTVRSRGKYPLNNGNSEFERTVQAKRGWFYQQLLKLYAGHVISSLNDYVLIDGDIVWMKPVTFIHSKTESGIINYKYATSSQYHDDYYKILMKLTGLGRSDRVNEHTSGIVHHMVIVKSVLKSLFYLVETRYLNSSLILSHNNDNHNRNNNSNSTKTHNIVSKPFWWILLHASAELLTCAAPKTRVCGRGSVLSEYEIYFHYARQIFPKTMTIRSLIWANGPKPGLLYWPMTPILKSDHGDKNSWVNAKQATGLGISTLREALDWQIAMDENLGFDFIGYHSYAKRRYYEIPIVDISTKCYDYNASSSDINSTCSWKNYHHNSTNRWWKGCLCRALLQSTK